MCVESRSDGNASLSTIKTRRPSRASKIAAALPATRAPTIITSKFFDDSDIKLRPAPRRSKPYHVELARPQAPEKERAPSFEGALPCCEAFRPRLIPAAIPGSLRKPSGY